MRRAATRHKDLKTPMAWLTHLTVVLGYVFAVLEALGSGSGSILESTGIRRAGAYGGTSLDLVNLRRQFVYVSVSA